MATWVAAIGTISAVVVALLQVARERKLRLDRERSERSEKHRAHAELIAAWVGPPQAVPHNTETPSYHTTSNSDADYRTPIYIHNGSLEPIYEIVVGIVFVQGAAPHNLEKMLDVFTERSPRGPLPATTSAIIPPGTWCLWLRGKGWTGVMGGRGGADIAFVDRGGVSWVRRAMGTLEELDQRPLAHFAQHRLYGPYEFQLPKQM